jgi:hypothetical protein
MAACELDPGKLGETTFSVSTVSLTVADFDLSATAGRIVGLVTGDGAPLAGVYVAVDGLCGSFRTDNGGVFARILPPGTYSGGVYSSGGGKMGAFTFSILAGQTTDVDIGTTPAGADRTVDLSGGIASVGGVSLGFDNVTASGSTTVVVSGSGPPPPTGFNIVGMSGEPRYWDIDATATFTGNLLVCIHYDGTQVSVSEASLRLYHDDGSGWHNITCPAPGTEACPAIDTVNDIICGMTTSLSPFVVVEPIEEPTPANTLPEILVPLAQIVEATSAAGALVSFTATATDAEDGTLTPSCAPASGSMFPIADTTVTCQATDSGGLSMAKSFTVSVVDSTGPAFVDLPTVVSAYATSTQGANVTYTPPAAADAVDGLRPVVCTPASGRQFPVNKSLVTCQATDARGNESSATFTVWVTYQAPTDGSFFVGPILANGSAVFQLNRTVPVKFALTGVSAPIQDLVARVTATKISSAVAGTVRAEGETAVGETDLTFEYDPVEGVYKYLWRTQSLTTGTYRLRADLGDGVVHEVDVSLRR